MVVITPSIAAKVTDCSLCRSGQASSISAKAEGHSRPLVILPCADGHEVSFPSKMTTSGFFPRAGMTAIGARPTVVRLGRL